MAVLVKQGSSRPVLQDVQKIILSRKTDICAPCINRNVFIMISISRNLDTSHIGTTLARVIQKQILSTEMYVRTLNSNMDSERAVPMNQDLNITEIELYYAEPPKYLENGEVNNE